MEPQTRYADANGVKIAYQALGNGPDVLLVPGFVSHLEMEWQDPARRRFLRGIMRFARLVRYDKRGTGLSDPVGEPPNLEQRIDEMNAVREAAGCPEPVLFGFSEGGPIAIQYAARYPDRIRGLVLYGTFGRQPPQEVVDRANQMLDAWGEGTTLEVFAPSVQDNEARRRASGAMERAGASPAMARALVEALRKIDVMDILADVHVPTLVLHRRDEYIPLFAGEEIAAGIPGAQLVVLEGVDHQPWVGNTDAILAEIERFVEQHGSSHRKATRDGARPRRPLTGWASLTPAELSVVRHVQEGLSNPEIAQSLFISRHTVETHLKRAFAKLGVASRTELVGMAAGNT
jgi:pimeloyl-ACP methyl ester carboxylesterase/DNA-binding CsgD family transcriptional regulator